MAEVLSYFLSYRATRDLFPKLHLKGRFARTLAVFPNRSPMLYCFVLSLSRVEATFVAVNVAHLLYRLSISSRQVTQ